MKKAKRAGMLLAAWRWLMSVCVHFKGGRKCSLVILKEATEEIFIANRMCSCAKPKKNRER